jgi:hypothetical protein
LGLTRMKTSMGVSLKKASSGSGTRARYRREQPEKSQRESLAKISSARRRSADRIAPPQRAVSPDWKSRVPINEPSPSWAAPIKLQNLIGAAATSNISYADNLRVPDWSNDVALKLRPPPSSRASNPRIADWSTHVALKLRSPPVRADNPRLPDSRNKQALELGPPPNRASRWR